MNEYDLQKKIPFYYYSVFCIWYLPLVEPFLIISINLAICSFDSLASCSSTKNIIVICVIRTRQTSYRGFSRKTKRSYSDPSISRFPM